VCGVGGVGGANRVRVLLSIEGVAVWGVGVCGVGCFYRGIFLGGGVAVVGWGRSWVGGGGGSLGLGWGFGGGVNPSYFGVVYVRCGAVGGCGGVGMWCCGLCRGFVFVLWGVGWVGLGVGLFSSGLGFCGGAWGLWGWVLGRW